MKPSELSIKLREYTATLRSRHAELEAERGQLAGEREALLTAPLRIDDAKQFIADYIDTCAAEYPRLANWRDLFDQVFYPRRYMHLSKLRPECGKPEPLCLRDVETSLSDPAGTSSTVFDGGLKFFGAASNVNTRSDYAAYFFFGDVIKARLMEHFDTFFPGYLPIDAERVGPPIAERRARIAVIDARLGEIDAEAGAIKTELGQLAASANFEAGKGETPAEAGERIRAEERDAAILRAYNGRNADELAKKYGVTARHVVAVSNRAFKPSFD